MHWHRARNLPNALEWSARAALEADAVHAYAEALRHYERALELWDRDRKVGGHWQAAISDDLAEHDHTAELQRPDHDEAAAERVHARPLA